MCNKLILCTQFSYMKFSCGKKGEFNEICFCGLTNHTKQLESRVLAIYGFVIYLSLFCKTASLSPIQLSLKIVSYKNIKLVCIKIYTSMQTSFVILVWCSGPNIYCKARDNLNNSVEGPFFNCKFTCAMKGYRY